MSDLLKYKDFLGSVEYSDEDGCLLGEVQFIEGKIVYFGDSIQELEAMFHEAVDGYLEMCQERGIEPLKPFKGSFNVRVGQRLHKLAALEAKRAGKSLNNFIADAIKEKLEPKSVHHHTHIHEAEFISTDVRTDLSRVPSVQRHKIVQGDCDRESAACH